MAPSLFRGLLAALLVTFPVLAPAQEDSLPTLDTRIETVVTRGHWTSGEASGAYRVIVLTEGWESIRRRVIVQWLEEDQDAQETVVRAVVDLGTILTDAYSVSAPVITKEGAAWRLTVRTSQRPYAQMTRPVVFTLGAPGTVRRIRGR